MSARARKSRLALKAELESSSRNRADYSHQIITIVEDGGKQADPASSAEGRWPAFCKRIAAFPRSLREFCFLIRAFSARRMLMHGSGIKLSQHEGATRTIGMASASSGSSDSIAI